MSTFRIIFITIAVSLGLFCVTCGDDVSSGNAGDDTDSNSSSDADSDTDSDSDADSDTEACGDRTVDFSSDPPTVLLLIDRSGSMTENFGNDSRWNVARTALVDAENGFVAQLESEIRFGLTMYAHPDTGSTSCPSSLEGIDPALDNYDEIAQLYNASEPSNNTPTAASVRAVTETLKDDTSPGSKVIVLVTDGLPDTCANPDSEDAAAMNASVDAVEAAFDAGIRTYVISVGDADNHFQDLANAGAGLDAGAKYFAALNQSELTDAFDNIISGVRECIFQLKGEVSSGSESECSVSINNNSVEFNGENGWRLNTASQMELLGSACETIQEGDVTVKVDCPCSSYTPVE